MEPKKRERLQSLGWRIDTVTDFLALSPEEASLIDLKVRQRAQKKLPSELRSPHIAPPKGTADSVALLREDRSR